MIIPQALLDPGFPFKKKHFPFQVFVNSISKKFYQEFRFNNLENAICN